MLRSVGFCLALSIGIACNPLMSITPVHAQGPVAGTDSDVFSMTERAKVTAIDSADRTLTLQMADGSTTRVKVGSEVRNFPQIKVGDDVVATVDQIVTYAILKAGTKMPAVVQTDMAGRAKKGEKPGAAAMRQTALTMLIVDVNPSAHTLDVIPQGGGQVRTLHVRNKERQAYLPKIQAGQLLSVVITSAIALSVEPAGS